MLDETAEGLADWLVGMFLTRGRRNGGIHTPMNSLTWRFCMRCSSWRCSACVSLSGEDGQYFGESRRAETVLG